MTKTLKTLLIILGVVMVGGLAALAFQSLEPAEDVVETEEPVIDDSKMEEVVENNIKIEKEEPVIDDSKMEEVVENNIKIEKEVIEAQDYYENKIYGYKIEIPASFEYELQYSGEIVKENNFLEENVYGHHSLVIGKKRLRTKVSEEERSLYSSEYYYENREFARVILPIKVDDFRQYYAERGWSKGIDRERNLYPPVNSIDDWIEHYEMGRNSGTHGDDWECSKEIVAKNIIVVCKRQNLAAAPYLYYEYGEYFFITGKGGFIIQSNVVTDFGPEPSDWSDTSLHHIVNLEKDMKWLYQEIEKMISSFYFLD